MVEPRLSLAEKLADVRRRLALPRWNTTFEANEWFFPGDVAPHSAQFKRQCASLWRAGLLERQGDSNDRWGYRYRIPEEIKNG